MASSNRWSSLLPSIQQTRAVGANRPNFRPFNDMVEIGGFPVEQKIESIRSIQIFGRDRVEGINVVYLMQDGKQYEVLHGRNSGQAQEIILIKENDYLVGCYGRRSADESIGTISFVLFEGDNGRVLVKGPYGQPPQAAMSFGTFGNLVAFAGTSENAFGLCSLSLLKAEVQNLMLL
ncbi:hypothetical protein FB451DRAFT_1373998 [Mycena latifolia]|nr:hypothetical protein FB451DRAFT_1373998 [Mycena latifolia]